MIKNLLDAGGEPERESRRYTFAMSRAPEVITLFDEKNTDEEPEDFVITDAPVESAGETARRNGLAFSAGVAFFSAVVFMLVLGWLADLFFGTSPWGIVFGIVLGSAIGFIQLFRLSSQIFKS